MREIGYLQAVREAQYEELQRDPRVIVIGQDLRANVYGAAAGLLDEFGESRIRDMPTSETGGVGAATGAAMTGLRPIVDMTIASFMYVAFDQFANQVAKNRYMSGGRFDIPIVFRASMFYRGQTAAQHADRPYPLFMNVPGLKITVPSTPADAKGLLKAAVRDPDPVIQFEDSLLWGAKGPVSDDPDLVVPLGVADVKREGSDVTVVAIASGVRASLDAAETLAAEGIEIEVIDPRSLVPFDWATVLASVRRTGRLVVVDPATRTCSAASEIAATVTEEAFDALKAPIRRVTTPDVHAPFSPALEAGLYPDAPKVVAAVRAVLGR
ncbi:MAG: transketolase C-terminal domain-containing protein [Thermoleophilia bacterium]